MIVRSVIIESAEGNTGVVYISDSEANATTLNRHVLYGAGDTITLSGSPYGNLNAELNLNDLWLHGTIVGDRVVVTYATIQGDYT